jgi:hypothetical protein
MNHTSFPQKFDKLEIELDVHLQAWTLMCIDFFMPIEQLG